MSTSNSDGFGFCRDCLVIQQAMNGRCGSCGSPRLLRHAELYDLSLAHIDCDAFYAAVEKRDDPTLRDKPVIIGGGKRGVVSTACYIARINGVRSAMPMFKALQACPEAVVIRPDMKKYSSVGRELRDMMRALTPLVEPISIDEAFLDLAGTQRLHGEPAALVLARFSNRIETELGISASVGLSYCKFLAKVASDFQKPRGFAVIGRREALEFLGTKPVSLIWGVGKAFNATLERDGIRLIGQLQTMEETELMRRYGTMGQRLFRLSRGLDTRQVHSRSAAKSVSSETTFNSDLSSLDDLVPVLRSLSEKVSARMKKSEIAGQTVVLKLKTQDFKLRTRNRQLPDPTQLADKIFQTGVELLRKETDGTKYRLIGIGVSDLCNTERADPPEFIDSQSTKRAVAEGAIDSLRRKFGDQAIETGYTFTKGHRARPQRDLEG